MDGLHAVDDCDLWNACLFGQPPELLKEIKKAREAGVLEETLAYQTEVCLEGSTARRARSLTPLAACSLGRRARTATV